MVKWILIFLLLWPQAEAAKRKKKTKIFKNDWTLSSLHSYENHQVQFEGINLGNQVFATPEYEFIHEARPEFEVKYRKTWELNLRPTLQINLNQVKQESPADTTYNTNSTIDLKEAYLSYLGFKDWGIRFGLLTYQWGPAELFSPSNGLFHFSKEAKSFSYLEKGYVLTDLIYNFSDSTNMQILAEVIDNKEGSWTYNVDYKSRGLLKFEHSFENSLNYLGITLGTLEARRDYLGAYGNWVPVEGYSIYVDGRLTQGDYSYRPVAKSAGRVDMLLNDSKEETREFVIAGFRYEGDFDFRFEGLYFDEGYSQVEISDALASLSPLQPLFVENAKANTRPGLEFLAKRYFYSSLRIPDIWWKNQMALSLRGLQSIEGKSSLLTVSLETPVGETSTVYFEHQQNYGRINSEFLLFEKAHTSIGMKFVYF